jgi:hypothetical protein
MNAECTEPGEEENVSEDLLEPVKRIGDGEQTD